MVSLSLKQQSDLFIEPGSKSEHQLLHTGIVNEIEKEGRKRNERKMKKYYLLFSLWIFMGFYLPTDLLWGVILQ